MGRENKGARKPFRQFVPAPAERGDWPVEIFFVFFVSFCSPLFSYSRTPVAMSKESRNLSQNHRFRC